MRDEYDELLRRPLGEGGDLDQAFLEAALKILFTGVQGEGGSASAG